MNKIHNPVVLINKPDNNAWIVAITDGSQNYQDARLMASMELDITGDGADTWSRVGFYMATEIDVLRQRIAELTDALTQMINARKAIIRAGYDRITECGGDCDSPEEMILKDPDIRMAEMVLNVAARTMNKHFSGKESAK